MDTCTVMRSKPQTVQTPSKAYPDYLFCSPSGAPQQQLVVHGAMNGAANGVSKALLPTAAGGNKEYTPSAAVAKRLPSKWPRPAWHPPWKLFRVISGHLGCVYRTLFLLCDVSAGDLLKILLKA